MPRMLVVAAGQMGPASDDKTVKVETVLRLMDEAAGSGAAIICVPELSLTTIASSAIRHPPLRMKRSVP